MSPRLIGADTSGRIEIRSIMEAQRYVPEDEIIGPHYFGNRDEIVTLVGQSGKGKSTLGILLSVSLVLGRAAFGLTTRKPRRVLIIQA